jgi:hypothetical protein
MSMARSISFATAEEIRALHAFASLAVGNPFGPERVAAERAALGDAFVEHGAVWHVDAAIDGTNPNVPRLFERAEALAERIRSRLAKDARASDADLGAYRGLVLYLLFERSQAAFYRLVREQEDADAESGAAYERYRRDFDHFLRIPGAKVPLEHGPAHIFALGYQIRRAFHHLYRGIYGGSFPAARLREQVWQSIFTHDAERYRRRLYERMDDVPTLIVGRSGTGKELVARAIGLSAYVPFDERRKRFDAVAGSLFHPVNLAALPSALIESELFGHRRGSFTGAVEDRVGWLEVCGARGTIFLDEIGELDATLQVKLLRVLQERSFQRLGESRLRRFEGRVVAATNRDLAAEMAAGRFRSDLYYRLCADVIETPTLAEQIADDPAGLENLVLVLALRILEGEEASRLAAEVVRWIEANLGRDYPWPGNVRELEQCVRNVLVRGSYRPLKSETPGDALADAFRRGEWTADALLSAYCSHVYDLTGSYEGAARRLGLDRRTVKSRVDPALRAGRTGPGEVPAG